MKPLKIGIVEDDLLIAESIAVTLQQIGYLATIPVQTYAGALQMIETESPDLLLVDIILKGDKDGIDLAETVNKRYNIPFIFLTANSDAATVSRAKEVNPSAYLVKPFNENDLFSSIEIAFSNFNTLHQAENRMGKPANKLDGSVFVKEGEVFLKVNLNTVLYIESDNVYLHLHTPQKHYLVRSKLDDFISEYARGSFVRVHRSYAVNLNFLEAINALTVTVAGKEIPMNKVYRDDLLNVIQHLK